VTFRASRRRIFTAIWRDGLGERERRAPESFGLLVGIQVRFRAGFAYVAGELPDEEEPLTPCRLRFTGVLHTWGFALHLASRGKYDDNFLPTGLPFGSLEDALDCACGFYLGDPKP